MAKDIKQYQVFIASPGGLDKEREGFRDTLRDYNEMDAVQRGAHFWPVGWEETLGGVGRPQSIINEEVRSCDYFIMILWDRWGSSPYKDGEGKYSSGTEEEYNIALECLADEKMPTRQIVVFFKAVDERMLSDPGEQLKKVLEFKKKLENEKTIFFHTYDEIENFKKLLAKYLAHWIRDHESGEAGKPAKMPIAPKVPPAGVEEVVPIDHETLAGEQAGMSDRIKEAWRLADEGKLTDAENLFAELSVPGTDADAISNYGWFLIRIGHLARAEIMINRALDINRKSHRENDLARQYNGLGVISKVRGNLDKAEQMFIKSLTINKRLGEQARMADNYGNLGVIYQNRGELDAAEQMFKKVLGIEQKLGRMGSKAKAYDNLGVIYKTRGDLDEAEQMHNKALEIEEKLGRIEGMASSYGNLGSIYLKRGDLDKAEQMYTKSLEINKKLGRLEGMANNYGNLGLAYKERRDSKMAREYWEKALEHFKKIGMKPEIKKIQGWLDKLKEK